MARREEIEQQAKSYTIAVFDELDDFSDVTQAYIDGAEWRQETIIEKACSYLYTKTKMSGTEINKFRKTMEE